MSQREEVIRFAAGRWGQYYYPPGKMEIQSFHAPNSALGVKAVTLNF